MNQKLITQTSLFSILYPEAQIFCLASKEFHLKTSERAMHHTSATSSSTLPCNDFDKVNWVCTISSSNICVSLHIFVLSKLFDVLIQSILNYIGFEISEATISYAQLWLCYLFFFALISCYKTYMTNLWETDFRYVQDLDKNATFSAPQNSISNLRR